MTRESSVYRAPSRVEGPNLAGRGPARTLDHLADSDQHDDVNPAP